MARIRFIKPEFFDDPDLADVSLAARLFFIGLWLQADKEGRLVDDMRRLKSRIFPFDDVDCEALAVELHVKDMIRRYKTRPDVEKHGYIWIRNFTRHQRPHPKEPASLIPPWEEATSSSVMEKHDEPGKNTVNPPDSGFLILDSGFLNTDSGVHTGADAPLAPPKTSTTPTTTKTPPVAPRPGAPIHTTHRSHAACGRVCVPATLHQQFVQALNRDDADATLRRWYLAVDTTWTTGPRKDDHPGGDAFRFWRDRFNERWPPDPAPTYAPKRPAMAHADEPDVNWSWTCPHVEEHLGRHACHVATLLGRPRRPDAPPDEPEPET